MTATGLFRIVPSVQVIYDGRQHTVLEVIDLDQVLIADPNTKKSIKVRVSELSPLPPIEQTTRPDLASIHDKDWKGAQEKFDVIKPLLNRTDRTKDLVRARASEFGLNPATLYKWISAFESTGQISALLPRNRSDKGAKQLPEGIEQIVTEVVQLEYLTSQRRSIRSVALLVRKTCIERGVQPPHENTVRKRIEAIAESERLSRRYGRKLSEARFNPVLGSIPDAETPLAIVEIDHTKVDLILVDDVYRRPVGRPWITLAIDVYSRMVVGFYVSFDPPGALGTGLCVAHAVLSKEEWLTNHQVDGEWPCWGAPKKIFCDNAKEFRGSLLKRACAEYQIDLEWRPAGRPNFGGHIERLVGTLHQEIHTLSGTTFSNTMERGEYDSEGKATLSLFEFETWLTTFIVQVYHRRIHSSLGLTPLERYRQGVFGSGEIPGSGLPPRVADGTKLRLDLMPFVERTVQNYGVAIDEIEYFHDVLRRWIHATEPGNKKAKRRFTFRRDPRDISVVWFFDPEVHLYYAIPYRNTTHPPMSIWELREAKARLKEEGKKSFDEVSLFKAYDRMREIEKEAKGKTTAVRRAEQRRAKAANSTVTTVMRSEAEADLGEFDPTTIKPFEEMDDLR